MATGKVLLWNGEEDDVVKVFSKPVPILRVKQVIEKTLEDAQQHGYKFVSMQEHRHNTTFKYKNDEGDTTRFSLEDVDIE